MSASKGSSSSNTNSNSGQSLAAPTGCVSWGRRMRRSTSAWRLGFFAQASKSAAACCLLLPVVLFELHKLWRRVASICLANKTRLFFTLQLQSAPAAALDSLTLPHHKSPHHHHLVSSKFSRMQDSPAS